MLILTLVCIGAVAFAVAFIVVFIVAARVFIGALHELGEHLVGISLPCLVHVDDFTRKHLLLIIVVLLVIEQRLLQASRVRLNLIEKLKHVLPLLSHVLLYGQVYVIVSQNVVALLPVHVLHALVDDLEVLELVRCRHHGARGDNKRGFLAEGDLVDFIVGVY